MISAHGGMAGAVPDNQGLKEECAVMRKQGTVVRWDETKGFGFIQGPATHTQLFFHIRDWRGGLAPQTRQRVSFEEIHVGGKGPRAMDVRPDDAPMQASPPKPAQQKAPRPTPKPSRQSSPRAQRPTGPAMVLMLLWAALLVAGVASGHLSGWFLPAAVVLNLTTFYLYWQDKFAATQGAWRTAENTLHLFGLIGGWPGAWFAHQILRHKSTKQAFRRVFWMTAVLNVIALGAWVLLPSLPLP